MIEELKMILEMVGDVSGIALWVLGFFLLAKLIMFLSTTGATVFLVKLAIDKLHGYLTHEKKTIWKLNGIAVDDSVKSDIEDVLMTVRKYKHSGLNYIHDSGSKWLSDAVKEKIERENGK